MARPITLPEPWRSLALKLGGVQALADRLGTTPRTINRWANGKMGMNGLEFVLFDSSWAKLGLEKR